MTAVEFRRFWNLDPTIGYLNHGSFGACPIAVIERQRQLQDQLEREPVRFMFHERPALLAKTREQVAEFVGAKPTDLVFVNNATSGVNAVLRSLEFGPDDELLTTNHTYAACRYVLEHVASRSGAKLVVADIPFPIASESQVVDSLLEAVTERTKLALVDHISSPTGLVFPIAEITARLAVKGVPVLVDGAHAPGMVPLDLERLGAAYYAANFHKWVCAPKGAGMLWVREDLQAPILPGVISHGYAHPGARFQPLFDWTGTEDPSAWLSVGAALDHLAEIGGGWPALQRRNRELALYARDRLCAALQIPKPAPDSMLGALAAVPLPDGRLHSDVLDPLQFELFNDHQLEVVVHPWPQAPKRVLRVSAQLYNHAQEYDSLAALLPALLT